MGHQVLMEVDCIYIKQMQILQVLTSKISAVLPMEVLYSFQLVRISISRISLVLIILLIKESFLFAKNSAYIQIIDFFVISVFSILNGGVIFIDKSLTFIANNAYIMNSESQSNGIICLQEPRSRQYLLTNLYCKGNKAILGSCIFAYSNANFDIFNFTIENSHGNAIYFFSLGGSNISMNTFNFIGNNIHVYSTENSFSNLIQLNNIKLSFLNGYISYNLATQRDYLINMVNSIVNINTSNFQNSGCFNQEKSIVFFLVKNSIFIVDNCNFTNNQLNLNNNDIITYNSAVGYFDQSEIILNSINAFNNKHDLDALFMIIQCTFTLKYSNFTNNIGFLNESLNIQGSNISISYCFFDNNMFSLFNDSSFTDVGLPSQNGANDIFIMNSVFEYFTSVVIFIFYPSIMKMCFSLINCKTIDNINKIQVMVSYPSIECWTTEHITWISSISITGIVLWGFFIPFLCFIFLYKNRELIKKNLEIDREKNSKNNVKSLFNRIKSSFYSSIRLNLKFKDNTNRNTARGLASIDSQGKNLIQPSEKNKKIEAIYALDNINLMSFLFKGYIVLAWRKPVLFFFFYLYLVI